MYHRRRLLLDVARHLGVSVPTSVREDDEGETLQQELCALLACNGIKKSSTDWSKALTAWFRNSGESSDRTIFRLLACDGFKSIVTLGSKNLKEYLSNVVEFAQLKRHVKKHARAVRKMYDWFDDEPLVSALTGLDSSCVVFLSLIRLFKTTLGLNVDDYVRVVMDRAEISTLSFLQKRADTRFKDVSNVDDSVKKTLQNIYVESFPEWETYIHELLNQLVCVWCPKDEPKVTRQKK